MLCEPGYDWTAVRGSIRPYADEELAGTRVHAHDTIVDDVAERLVAHPRGITLGSLVDGPDCFAEPTEFPGTRVLRPSRASPRSRLYG